MDPESEMEVSCNIAGDDLSETSSVSETSDSETSDDETPDNETPDNETPDKSTNNSASATNSACATNSASETPATTSKGRKKVDPKILACFGSYISQLGEFRVKCLCGQEMFGRFSTVQNHFGSKKHNMFVRERIITPMLSPMLSPAAIPIQPAAIPIPAQQHHFLSPSASLDLGTDTFPFLNNSSLSTSLSSIFPSISIPSKDNETPLRANYFTPSIPSMENFPPSLNNMFPEEAEPEVGEQEEGEPEEGKPEEGKPEGKPEEGDARTEKGGNPVEAEDDNMGEDDDDDNNDDDNITMPMERVDEDDIMMPLAGLPASTTPMQATPSSSAPTPPTPRMPETPPALPALPTLPAHPARNSPPENTRNKKKEISVSDLVLILKSNFFIITIFDSVKRYLKISFDVFDKDDMKYKRIKIKQNINYNFFIPLDHGISMCNFITFTLIGWKIPFRNILSICFKSRYTKGCLDCFGEHSAAYIRHPQQIHETSKGVLNHVTKIQTKIRDQIKIPNSNNILENFLPNFPHNILCEISKNLKDMIASRPDSPLPIVLRPTTYMYDMMQAITSSIVYLFYQATVAIYPKITDIAQTLSQKDHQDFTLPTVVHPTVVHPTVVHPTVISKMGWNCDLESLKMLLHLERNKFEAHSMDNIVFEFLFDMLRQTGEIIGQHFDDSAEDTADAVFWELQLGKVLNALEKVHSFWLGRICHWERLIEHEFNLVALYENFARDKCLNLTPHLSSAISSLKKRLPSQEFEGQKSRIMKKLDKFIGKFITEFDSYFQINSMKFLWHVCDFFNPYAGHFVVSHNRNEVQLSDEFSSKLHRLKMIAPEVFDTLQIDIDELRNFLLQQTLKSRNEGEQAGVINRHLFPNEFLVAGSSQLQRKRSLSHLYQMELDNSQLEEKHKTFLMFGCECLLFLRSFMMDVESISTVAQDKFFIGG